MFYRAAGDLVVLLHFFWILFLIFGAFPGRKYLPVKILHIAGLSFAFIMQIFGWYCPLTDLEIWLKNRYEPSVTYKGSFIIHYVEKIVYIELPPWIIFLLTVILIAISVLIYHRGKTNRGNPDGRTDAFRV
jgi:hypothetical protein